MKPRSLYLFLTSLIIASSISNANPLPPNGNEDAANNPPPAPRIEDDSYSEPNHGTSYSDYYPEHDPRRNTPLPYPTYNESPSTPVPNGKNQNYPTPYDSLDQSQKKNLKALEGQCCQNDCE